MKHFILSILSFFVLFQAQAQFDPEAGEIIKPVSEAILSSSGVSADFVFTLENKQNGMTETDSGKLEIKGNKYHLSVLGTETYFDGSTQWVHMVDEEEVNISSPDPEDNMELTPVNLFNLYANGFRFKIVDKTDHMASIDMFPDDESMPYFKIRLVLDTSKQTFEKVIAFGRDGINTTIDINNMKKDLNLNENKFVFNSTQYPDVDVIDMR